MTLKTSDTLWFVKAEERVWGPFAEDRFPVFLAERRLSARTLISSAAIGPFLPAGEEPRLRHLFAAGPAPALDLRPAEAAGDEDEEETEPEDPRDLREPRASGGFGIPPDPREEGSDGESLEDNAEEEVGGRGDLEPFPAAVSRRHEAEEAAAALDLSAPLVPARAEPTLSLLVIAELRSLSAEDLRARLTRFGVVDAICEGVFLVTAPLSAALLRNTLSRGLGGEDVLIVSELSPGHAAWFNLPDAAERRLFRL